MDGLLLVDKPEGISSGEVVRLAKKKIGVRKVGHLGTLDPFASGILPLCMGEGTKVAPFLSQEKKAYAGVIKLGVETDTLDRMGAVLWTKPVSPFGDPELRNLERVFSGEILQTPPMYSAVKFRGVPLYKLARRGVEVQRPPRRIVVEFLSLARGGKDEIAFRLRCSKGTYVRVIARDIGNALGCGAHLSQLQRTAFGPFTLIQAISLRDLSWPLPPGSSAFLSLRQTLAAFREITVTPATAERVHRGQQEPLWGLPQTGKEEEVAVLITPQGDVVAVVGRKEGHWRLLRVFHSPHIAKNANLYL